MPVQAVDKGTDPVVAKVQVLATDKGTDPVVAPVSVQAVGTDPVVAKVPVQAIDKGTGPVAPRTDALAREAIPETAATRDVLVGEPVVAKKSVVTEKKDAVEGDEASGVLRNQPLQAAPVNVAADATGTVQIDATAVREVAAMSAATARTEAVVETVNAIVEAVVEQIVVTPSLTRGEGDVKITLKADVLDGSDIALSARNGTLAVSVTPATAGAAQAVSAAVPRLEVALAEHVAAFRHVAVEILPKKGKVNETV